MELVQKNVGALRKAPDCRIGEHFVPHVEGMLRPFREFFRYQLPASLNPTILRLNMNKGGIFQPWFTGLDAADLFTCSNRRRDSAQLRAAFLDKRGDEALQILLLFLGKPGILHASPVEYRRIDAGIRRNVRAKPGVCA
jgi:hypothetical protein